MHLRILTLEIVLVRLFQLPVELRTIIVEDFFPFLPVKTNHSFFCNPSTVNISTIQWDCSREFYLLDFLHDERIHRFAISMVDHNYQEATYWEPYKHRPSRCNGRCKNPLFSLQRCRDRRAMIRPTEIKDVDKNCLEKSEKDVLLWFYKEVMRINVA